VSWRPDATPDVLRLRAQMLQRAREFFADRVVMEVETPMLSGSGTTDPNIFNVTCQLALTNPERVYLHTSPEYFMKRLLAAGCPDIYQICKVFRDSESGRRHRPEFTMIEWYRQELDLAGMIDETSVFISALGETVDQQPPPQARRTYRDAFLHAMAIDPLAATAGQLCRCAADRLADKLDNRLVDQLADDRRAWLDLLMSHVVIPSLDPEQLVAITHYPADQAALARLDPANPKVAERFEIFYKGMELANGYRELQDPGEQRRRFELEKQRRIDTGLAITEPDEDLLAALEAGLPDCSGVAVGFDRVVMCHMKLDDIAKAMSFANHLTRDTYS
jgi:lysyl-tRNA synthetase class 2